MGFPSVNLLKRKVVIPIDKRLKTCCMIHLNPPVFIHAKMKVVEEIGMSWYIM
jgi:hypothetical protein